MLMTSTKSVPAAGIATAGSPAALLPAHAASVEPAWFGDAPASGNAAAARRAWAECVVNDRGGSVYAHPDVVLSARSASDRPPAVYLRWDTAGRTGALNALAVLAPTIYRVPLVPGLAVGLRVRGGRVLGDDLVGDRGPDSVAAFLKGVNQYLRSRRADCVRFDSIEVGSPLWDVLSTSGACPGVSVFYPGKPQPHWTIDFPEKADDYWQKFSSKTRSTFRRKAKKLEHTIVCFSTPDAVAPFLEQSHAVSRSTWQSKRLGLRIRNSPDELRYWTALARLGTMRCYVLAQNDKPLAFVVGVQWQGVFHYEELGYDPAFADFSPGTVLLFRLLEDLIARDTPRRVDFGFGDADYKQIFGTRQTQSGPVLLVRRGVAPMTAMWVDRVRRGASLHARNVFRRVGADRAIRKLYRK